MGKYANANILQTQIDESKKQQQLKNKHNIPDENIVVLSLSAIGAFTLLYTDLRQNFISILMEIIYSVFGG